MQKKRILLVSEFSLLNTGFSVMNHDILSYLHNSGEYEVAEFSSYVEDGDPRIDQIPWKVYPVIPNDSNTKEKEVYNNNYQTSQFGSERFNHVVLDFKPDIVFSYRDYWHDEYITRSPYRHLFHYIWSACVDSEPQRIDWISTYSTVDTMTSYTQWGLNTIKRQGGNIVNVADTDTMPGVDLKTFQPKDRIKSRDLMGLMDDVTIFLTVMRNQPRKLYPEIIRSFMKMIRQLESQGEADKANNTFLYLHTSNTDVGFDLEKQLIRYSASHKVLFTYVCDQCGLVHTSFSKGQMCKCPKCSSLRCHTANTSFGVDREQLSNIYNCADAYLQVSTAGALEIPIIEAKACGIPTMTSDYAAPYELLERGGNFHTVKTICFREEGIRETEQLRGYVDDQDITEGFLKFMSLDNQEKKKLGLTNRKIAEEYHDSNKTAEKWISIFEKAEILSSSRWSDRPQYINIDNNSLPMDLNDSDFARYMIQNFTPPKHQMKALLFEKELLHHSLSTGNMNQGVFEPVSKGAIIQKCNELIDDFNHWEQHRHDTVNGISVESRQELFEVI